MAGIVYLVCYETAGGELLPDSFFFISLGEAQQYVQRMCPWDYSWVVSDNRISQIPRQADSYVILRLVRYQSD